MNKPPQHDPINTQSALLKVNNVYKAYEGGLIPALNDVSLILNKGEIYALMGPSGCGKSTLLNIIGTLDFPTSGSVNYVDKRVDHLEPIHKFRHEIIGFIFQFHHLLPVLTLQENVETPLLANKNITDKARQKKACGLLDELGLKNKKGAYANRVSGGERQRAAIARALANDPLLILADEPTGSVDSKTADIILKKLISYTKNINGTLLIATHNENIANLADTIIRMKDGKITDIENIKKQDVSTHHNGMHSRAGSISRAKNRPLASLRR